MVNNIPKEYPPKILPMYKSHTESAKRRKRNPNTDIKLPPMLTFFRPKYPDNIPQVSDPTKELAVKILA